MGEQFTLAQARALIPDVRRRADAIVRMRADLAEAHAAIKRGAQPDGGMAQAKALEAHLQEAVDWFGARGIDVKGLAPLIVDFPSELDGEQVLLCWLEGEADLGWFHPAGVGFVGRRRLPEQG